MRYVYLFDNMIVLPIVDQLQIAVCRVLQVRHYGVKDQSLDNMAPALAKFGDLFRKHGKYEHLALSLVHRHFKLNDGERIVAKQNSINSTIEMGPISEEEASNAIPYLLLPMKNEESKAGLAPLEYFSPIDDKHRACMEKELEAACDEEFLKEFLALAKTHQVDGVYGLMLRSRDTLPIQRHVEAYLEGPGKQDRSLVVEIVSKEKYESLSDIARVAWVFEKEVGSKAKEASGCYGYWCCRVCSSH